MAGIPVNTTIQTQIANLYIAILGRNPEPTGFGFWCDTLANNGGTTAALNAITLGFSNAPEFIATYGGRTTSSAVTLMYNNVLDRAPDSAGLTYWTNIANAYIAQGYTIAQAYALTGNAIITTAAANTGTADQALIQSKEAAAIATGTSETYTLTTSPDTATAVTFLAPKAYTPGGTDLVNTLQNEDVLTGNTFAATTLGTVTSLTGDLGNPNDSGASVIAPTMTNVQTVNIAFTNTLASSANLGLTLDFQDINGTTTANMTRISNDLRDSFVNLGNDVVNLGIANTSEAAKATITYLNNELGAANNAVTLTLNNASLSNTQTEYDNAGGAALQIVATAARGSDLQNQIETYNVVTAGTSGSTVATFKTGVSDYNDNVVGQRPVTVNITTGATASLAVGTLRWLGNRVETNSANTFQASFSTLHQVGTNGLGFVDVGQIRTINVAGASNVTLANVGNWINLDPLAASVGSVNFTLNAATLTGNLVADLGNAASSIYSTITGGLGSDQFYVAGKDTVVSATITPVAVNVLAQISGGAAVDSLTVQSNAGGTVNLAAGSTGIENLNLVQGIVTAGEGGGNWTADLANGGFTAITFNNQDADSVMSATLTNFNAATTSLSVRSAGLTDIGDNATLVAPAVNINFTQLASVVGGTVNLTLGSATDDRAINDAFSARNHTSFVSIIDETASGATNAATSLNLVVNTAGLSGTGAANITVNNGDFLTLTTLTSGTGALAFGTNTVNIGYQVSGTTVGALANTGGNSNYPVGTNALYSSTYNGGAYAGSQNVTFGGIVNTATTGKSHTITTGTAADIVDLSYMVTDASNTSTSFDISQKLLNTSVNMGGGNDTLVLSATLADPRLVTLQDPTYDGYFYNWSNIENLTINNRNGINSAYVALDAYAQINNANLSTVNFNDVSGTLDVGFRFTNPLTVNVDAAATNTATTVNAQAAKTTTIISQSTSDLTLFVDESYALNSPFTTGNKVVFTSTGAALGNNVTLNYTNLSNAGQVFDSNTLQVAAGSLDVVNWQGNIGATAAGVAGNGGTITVTTADTWTENTQTTTYNFTNVVNLAGTAAGSVVFTAAAETGVIGLTINGSTDGGDATNATAVVSNTITGSAGGDAITSGGLVDTLSGGSGNDSITYNASTATASINGVTIYGDLISTAATAATATGNDTIFINYMVSTESAAIFAGGGNDTVTVGNEVDTYTFSNVALTAAGTVGAPGATVSQTVINVGSDTINGFNFGTSSTAVDAIKLSAAVFGANVVDAAPTTGLIRFATANDAVVAAGATANNSFLAVQAATGGDVDLYYVQSTYTNQSAAQLVQAGSATLIGHFQSTTGLVDIGDFAFVA